MLSHNNDIVSLVICSILLSSISVCSGSTRFVYTNAPEKLILQAREVGENGKSWQGIWKFLERLKFLEAIQSAADEDEK